MPAAETGARARSAAAGSRSVARSQSHQQHHEGGSCRRSRGQSRGSRCLPTKHRVSEPEQEVQPPQLEPEPPEARRWRSCRRMEARAERDNDSRRNDRALPLPPRAAGQTRPPPKLEPGPAVQPPVPEASVSAVEHADDKKQLHEEVAVDGAGIAGARARRVINAISA